jgi:hypothetical protein
MNARQVPHIEPAHADVSLVTRRKKRTGTGRRRDNLLLALHERLRPLNDPVAIQTAAVEVLGEHLGCDWANYAEYDEDYAHTIVRCEYRRDGAPSLQGRHPIEPSGMFLSARVQAARSPKATCSRHHWSLTRGDGSTSRCHFARSSLSRS